MCTKFNLKIDESTELLDTNLMTTIQMNCYYYPILLNNHALKFYSILILSADSPIFNNFLDIPLLFLEFLIQDHL